MNKETLTTKGSGSSYLMSQLFSDLLFVVAGIFCARSVGTLQSQWEFEAAKAMSTFSMICFAVAFLSILYHIMVFQSVAEIDEYEVKGKGMQGISAKSFSVHFDQISDISISKGFLNIETGKCVYLIINTATGNYKVITTPEKAKQFVEYFHNNRK